MKKASQLALLGGKPIFREKQTYQWPVINKNTERYVLRALRSGKLGYGVDSVTRDLENAFAEYHGSKYAIATNSGTSALMLAFFACGVGFRQKLDRNENGDVADAEGSLDEVIVPAYGFFATASPLVYLNAKIIFCDVCLDTGNIDTQKIEPLISPRTKAIVVTHVSGHPAEMDDLVRLSKKYNVFIIEDCSHAHGAIYKGRKVGTFGRVAAFSLQTLKMVSGGEGGIVLTDDDLIFQRAAVFANFRRLEGTDVALPDWFSKTGLGLKLRMSPLSAALAHYFLDNLDALIEVRKENLDYLTSCLSAFSLPILPPTTYPHVSRGAYYEYLVRCLIPDEEIQLSVIKSAIEAEGAHVLHSNTCAIYTLPIFQHNLHEMMHLLFTNSISHLDCSKDVIGSYPNADRLERQTFALPPLTHVSKKIVRQYAEAIAKVFRKRADLTDVS